MRRPYLTVTSQNILSLYHYISLINTHGSIEKNISYNMKVYLILASFIVSPVTASLRSPTSLAEQKDKNRKYYLFCDDMC